MKKMYIKHIHNKITVIIVQNCEFQIRITLHTIITIEQMVDSIKLYSKNKVTTER